MKKIILNCLIIVSLVLAFAVVANAENNITIYVNEQALQCDVEPYAENGRTLYVPNSEVKAHQNVGWYKSKTEADAAGAKSYSSSNNSQTSTSQSNNNNRSNSGAVQYTGHPRAKDITLTLTAEVRIVLGQLYRM